MKVAHNYRPLAFLVGRIMLLLLTIFNWRMEGDQVPSSASAVLYHSCGVCVYIYVYIYIYWES